MPDDSQENNDRVLKELVRSVRDLNARVQQLEGRLDREFSSNRESRANPSIFSSGSRLESKIGSQWLNRIGVIAVLFGVAYLLRYAFVNEWISAAAWIWLGVWAGLAIIAASEWFRRLGYRVPSISLKATGVGVCFLSLWAGMELYKLLSGTETFLGLLILNVVSVALALRESAEVLAALALVGGFLTPLLISIPTREAPLFLYIVLLDCASVAVLFKRRWWSLLPLGFVGTILLSSTWYLNQYRRTELMPAAITATIFFLIYCVTPVLVRARLSAEPAPRLLTWIELANPLVYFSSLYLLMNHGFHNSLAIPAIILSVLYFGLAWKREQKLSLTEDYLLAVYGGLGIAFTAVAITILLPSDWLSLGWFLDAAVVMAAGFWRDLSWLRWGALSLLSAAVAKAFLYDVWQLGLGYRTLSFIGLGILLLIISFAYQRYGFSMVANKGKDSKGQLS